MTFIFCVDYINILDAIFYLLDLLKKSVFSLLKKGKEARRLGEQLLDEILYNLFRISLTLHET